MPDYVLSAKLVHGVNLTLAQDITRCPELWNPLKEGFFEGGGSNQSHDHEDEKVDRHCIQTRSQDLIKIIESNRND